MVAVTMASFLPPIRDYALRPPGVYHCNRGPGPNFFDALATLEQWVERGRAPDQMVATKYANDDSTQPALRTACSENQDLLKIGPNGAGAGSARLGGEGVFSARRHRRVRRATARMNAPTSRSAYTPNASASVPRRPLSVLRA